MYLNHERYYADNSSKIEKAKQIDRIINNLKNSGKICNVDFLLKNIFGINKFDNRYENAFEGLMNIVTACNEWHPNNWTFDINCEIIDSTYFKIRNKKLYLVILYPEFEIFNRDNKTHTIKNLIVSTRILLDSSDGNISFKTELTGKRFTFNCKELYYDYSHSHLKADTLWEKNFYSFCHGTEIENPFLSSLISSVENFKDLDVVTNVILNIENFVSYESIEGNPWKNISSIVKLPVSSSESLFKYKQNSISPMSDSSGFHYLFKDLILFINDKEELKEEFINSVEVCLDSHFIVFKDYDKLNIFLIKVLKQYLLTKNEEELENIFYLLTYNFYKKVNNNYEYIVSSGNDSFNFTTWLSNKLTNIKPDTYWYNIGNRIINFEVTDVQDYQSEVQQENINLQFYNTFINEHLESYQVSSYLLNNLFEKLSIHSVKQKTSKIIEQCNIS